jgi:5-methylcytosine-specific restriction endonuclease McrA
MTYKEPCKTLEEIDREKVLENTRYYLETHLNPNRNWDRWVSPKERINQIRYSNVNWKTVSNYIRGMEYQDFLRTPYWKAIAAHSKFKAGYRCQVCNSPYDLATHHRNYAIHGFEHAHMYELVVLCNACHSKFHGQTPKSKFKAKAALIVLIIKLMVLSALAGHFLIEK